MDDRLPKALEAHQQGRIDVAEPLYLAVITADPNNYKARHLLGHLYLNEERLTEATVQLETAYSLEKQDMQLAVDYGILKRKTGKLKAALQTLQRVLKINPAKKDALVNTANILMDMDRPEEALQLYRKVEQESPDYPQLSYNLATALSTIGQQQDAIAYYRKHLDANPLDSKAISNYAIALQAVEGDLSKAIAVCRDALAKLPDSVALLSALGGLYALSGDHANAIKLHAKAAVLQPEKLEHKLALAKAYKDSKEYKKAEETLLPLAKEFGHELDVWVQLQEVQEKLGQLESSLRSIEKAYKLKPDDVSIQSIYWGKKMQACDWKNIEAARGQFIERVLESKALVGYQSPFGALSLPVPISLQEHRRLAQKFGRQFALAKAQPLVYDYDNPKIRLGFISPDIKEHPVSHLMIQLLRRIDRSKFEVYLYSLGEKDNSPVRYRMIAAADRYTDLGLIPNHFEAAAKVREDKLDIAFDLCGYTAHCRPALFHLRIAPAQVSYLGYIGTLGMEFMDYIVGDSVATPLDKAEQFSEKIIQMPDCFQSTDAELLVNEHITKEIVGLPEDKFIFCSLNNSYKYDPIMFDVWAKILAKAPESILWLYAPNSSIERRIRSEFKKRNVGAQRILFSGRASKIEYLGRLRLADVFLDTRLYNAGTTASDAIFVGVPIVAYKGELFVSRMAASIVTAINAPEMACDTLLAYEEEAVKMATDVDYYQKIKAKFKSAKQESVLFNNDRFARHFEDACVLVKAAAKKGQKKHIIVPRRPLDNFTNRTSVFTDDFKPQSYDFDGATGRDLIHKLETVGDIESADFIRQSMKEGGLNAPVPPIWS